MIEIELVNYKKCIPFKRSFCAMQKGKDCFSFFLNNKAQDYSDSTMIFLNKNNGDIIGYFTYRYITNSIVKNECPYKPGIEIMMFAIDIKYQDTYCNNRTKPIAAECLDIIVSLLKEQGFGSKQNSICLYAAAHAVDFYIMNYFVDITKYLILDKDVFFFVYNKQE